MGVRSFKFAWIVGGLGLSTLLLVHGQQAPPRRAQPIIFSETRQETVTSNLNEIVTQKGTLPRLGEFTKPSDITDGGDPGANMIAPPLRQLPAPNLSSKRLKALIEKREKRNDRAYQTPESQVKGLTPEEMFNIPDLGPDGREKKKTRDLERYYQGLEREQTGSNTNQVKEDELFDRQKQDDDRGDSTFAGTQPTPNAGAITTVPALKPLFGSDSININAFTPGMNKPQSWSESPGFADAEPLEVTRARETRLQNYKQLLDSGALAPPTASGTANPFNSTPAVQGFNPSRTLDSLPSATPPSSLGSLPRTTVGAPAGFGSDQQIVTPPPPTRVPLPPAFQVPKRPF
jgi:hypothetical protein